MIEYIFEFWWMLPIAFCICLIATSSSVEGAVFFTPIFILVFPLVAGVMIVPIEAIFLALSIELFGFGSAMIGYLRRNLIDLDIVKKVLPVSVPVGMGFGFLAHSVPSHIILGALGGLMTVLSGLMLYSFLAGGIHGEESEEGQGSPTRVDSLGRRYWYHYEHGRIGYAWSVMGGILVGLTGIGIGELTTTTLIIRNRLPVRVAVGTGIMIVFFTAFMATLVHAYVFSSGELKVHWNILFMTIPAVACGGQVSPFINSRVDGEKMKAFLSLVFIVVGSLLFWRGLGS
ncbi:MAG: sulfite exporter TauE/SafE family protein [Nitrospinaceae bacterium]|nr:sulfite exporter TauE/SafE family protein [Nitrospinaceae bacterium]MBT3434086.1 sulfite exporter TauE/SafE family protein [Nitrospinaceae bacterium]MBT3822837.1 sulfite exporter TauE/SafE family protein [Nitrospinaceae bacterium]MBT4094046.1 sulfite exporter TauE/SafE family protein [Nitrospinaceae bacterium]MBT4431427.1 sulfite exporter TauE/SafE family protein [Nitrospinaceae bacterium]